MKGIYWDGDATITKGCGSGKSTEMFSVGGIIAFTADEYSSPDGRQFSHGVIPTHENYKLQEEILLEEFNFSTFPGEEGVGPVGSMNRKMIVELSNEFWHEFSQPVKFKTFLLQIMEASENVFRGGISWWGNC